PDNGKPVLRATAQRIRVADDGGDDLADEPTPQLPPPDTIAPHQFEFPFEVGYHTALETRLVRGGSLRPGPATCWTRIRGAIVEGVPASPLGRVLAAADSGNGISNVLD